jgi:hypothetical protein
MSEVMVRKSTPVLVRPSSPPPATSSSAIVNLQPCDKAFVGIPNTALLVFTQPIHDPAGSIKRALAHALVHYHPLSGRLLRRAEAGGEEVGIACNGQGVSFVAATAAASVNDVRFCNRSVAAASGGATLLDDLAVYYPTADGDRPLVLVQVTEFSCGGYVVGVTWNHAAADGAGMGQFVKAVGDLARGLPSPAVLPVTRQDEWLRAVVPPSPSLLDIGRHFSSLDPPPDTVFLDIVVPASTISRVRAMATAMDGGRGRTVTVFEAVTAVLWRCHARATMSEPETPTVLCFSADLRRHVGAKDGYYANRQLRHLATSRGELQGGGDIVEVVKLIQHAKDQIRPEIMEKGKQRERSRPAFHRDLLEEPGVRRRQFQRREASDVSFNLDSCICIMLFFILHLASCM